MEIFYEIFKWIKTCLCFLPLHVCLHHKDIPGIIFNEMTEGYYANGKAVANYWKVKKTVKYEGERQATDGCGCYSA